MGTRRRVVAASVLSLLTMARVAAIERKPLPDFTIAALDGNPVKSVDLARQGRWLLVYVQPGCAACDALFRILDPTTKTDLPLAGSHLVIVVGGVDGPAAAKLASNFSDLTGASWYADPAMTLRAILNVPLAPVVFGLRNNGLEWSILGVQPDAAGVRSALVTWVGTAK